MKESGDGWDSGTEDDTAANDPALEIELNLQWRGLVKKLRETITSSDNGNVLNHIKLSFVSCTNIFS